MDRNEARVLEPGEDACLREERIGGRRPVEGRVHDLECEAAAQDLVLDLEDLAHAARAERPDEAIARPGEIGRAHGFPETPQRAVRDAHAGGSVPSRARASARNSSSEAVSSRRRPRTVARNSRRAAASWFVTSTAVVPNRAARSS